MFYIYEIFNDITQRRYIGLTQNPQERWKAHMQLLKNHKHTAENIVADYIRYGEDRFSFRLLDIAKTKEEGLDKEAKYMRKYQTYSDEFGYNGLDSRWSRSGFSRKIKDSDLKRKIQSQGYKLRKIPYLLGVPYNVFAVKMNNQHLFTEKEWHKLNEYISISHSERRAKGYKRRDDK